MSSRKKDVFALIIRIIVGAIFIFAGSVKLVTMGDTVAMFQSMGIATALVYVVAYAELLGGIAVLLGLWSELAAIGLAIIMIGAVYYSRSGGFALMMGPLATLAAVLSIVPHGAGAYSLGRFVPSLKRNKA